MITEAHYPDPNKPFSACCDASIDGVDSVLTQYHDGKLQAFTK